MNTLQVPRPDCPLEAAVRYFGSISRLARAIDATPQTVSNWRNRRRVSPLGAVRIEDATGGAIRKEELRPDLFDPRPGAA